ncbi:cytochrome b/b6 domain-containing protein [Rubellimicrobium arenae]|uniref:cytochrome b/b6 domain-containing protein n=1 Tax=Rubellimicrobium arenae TaxID=2817372 RepID=UPI001B312AB8|nr:cytochrome b/b6 domain-containing protein [Rubellimicrobium arenae]
MADTAPRGPLVYRQRLATRLTHWAWALSLFVLLLTGLQIFNAHPGLYLGDQSGFEFNNAVLALSARDTPEGLRGVTWVLGHEFDTTGLLGASGGEMRGFPSWATIPSYHDLATGRVIHFFFAWLLTGTLLLWLLASLLNGHWRELIPTGRDLRALPADVADHLRLRLHHRRRYNVLQKLSYAGVLFVLLPGMIVTGLCMSPSFNAAAPWLLDLLGGRQTARTLHFLGMSLLVLFFVVHLLMVVLAGPLNELRSILTGWYRLSPGESSDAR